jgi:hypothetical protein
MHNRLSKRRWRSWGVSLPSFPSFSERVDVFPEAEEEAGLADCQLLLLLFGFLALLLPED